MAIIVTGLLFFPLAVLPLQGAEVEVTIQNNAGVSQGTIRDAKTELARILAAAGLGLRCSVKTSYPAVFVEDIVPLSSASDAAVRCRSSRSIEAWIVAAPTTRQNNAALGYSLPLARRGRNVVIFRTVVNAVSARHGVDPSIILAHALAHEIAHVLLRSGEHSPHGLMSAAWSDREFELMSRIPLLFAAREVDLIKKTLSGEGCTD